MLLLTLQALATSPATPCESRASHAPIDAESDVSTRLSLFITRASCGFQPTSLELTSPTRSVFTDILEPEDFVFQAGIQVYNSPILDLEPDTFYQVTLEGRDNTESWSFTTGSDIIPTPTVEIALGRADYLRKTDEVRVEVQVVSSLPILLSDGSSDVYILPGEAPLDIVFEDFGADELCLSTAVRSPDGTFVEGAEICTKIHTGVGCNTSPYRSGFALLLSVLLFRRARKQTHPIDESLA